MATTRDLGSKLFTKSPYADDEPKLTDRELVDRLEGLDKRINELKAQYELFFIGVEKKEPVIQRDKIASELRQLEQMRLRSTRLKFQLQQLKTRMVSLGNHWHRILKQREEGTYRPDVLRANRRQEAIQAKLGQNTADKTATPGGKVATQPTKQPHVGATDLSDAHLRKVYEVYLNARQRCGETGHPSFEAVSAALKERVPKLLAQSGAQAVEFKVTIREGRAILKAQPKQP